MTDPSFDVFARIAELEGELVRATAQRDRLWGMILSHYTSTDFTHGTSALTHTNRRLWSGAGVRYNDDPEYPVLDILKDYADGRRPKPREYPRGYWE